jgi:hypothetical protein
MDGMEFGGASPVILEVQRDLQALPQSRPTDQEIRMIRDFPNDSTLLHELLETDGGTIVPETPADEQHDADPAWRQGRVERPDGTTSKRYELRAEYAGVAARLFFRAVGALVAEPVQPRGYLSGRSTKVQEQV